MKSLLSRYICVSVDKLSNNMFLACRCVMAAAQVAEITGGLDDQDATFAESTATAADIFADAQTVLLGAQIDPSDQRLPFQYPIPKLHKPQLAFRFITACSRFFLKNMALWVTRLMRTIECELGRIWRQLNFPSDLQFGGCRCG